MNDDVKLPGALAAQAIMRAADKVYRNGVEMQKGFILTTDFIEKHRKKLEDTMQLWSVYPDLFLDTIKLDGDNFGLFFYQRIFIRASVRYRYHYCTACFDENAEVITEDKVKSVKDVEAGDKVLTHNGWSTVLAPTHRLWNGDMVEIQGRDGIISPIRCTDTHEFYVVPRANENERVGTFSKKIVEELGGDYKQRKEFYRINCRETQAKWVQAKDLSCNDFLLSYIDERVEDVKWCAPTISSNHCTNLIKNEIEFDNNFAEWFGIWLAEGSWTDRAISFTIGLHEERLYNRILELTEQIFGLTHPTICQRDAKHSIIIQYNSKQLCLFFEQLYGRECDQVNQWTKYVPPSIMVGAPHIQLQLVKGWLDGDGYYRDATSPRYKGTTVSAMLAEQMQMILYRNFINPSITTELRNGRAKVYNVNVNGLFALRIHDAIESGTPVVVDFKVRQGKDYPILVNGKYYMRNRIQKIQTIPNCEQTVYCMKVKNTPSFTVNGVLAHNCRAFSKTFVSILALILKCVFLPRTHAFIVAPAKSQAAKNSKDKIVEIFQHWPLLKKEIVGGDVSDLPGLYGKDYITLNFRNESVLDVVGALDSTRGGRRHCGLIDEVRDHDADALNDVIIPLMNVNRRMPNGNVNPYEPHQAQLYMTSASQKSTYSYGKLIELFEQSIISPKDAFVWGTSYQVPMIHGLISKQFLNEVRTASTFSAESWAREYCSIWTGGSNESWFDYDRVSAHRKLVNPETHAKSKGNGDFFYILSVDKIMST